MIMIQIGIPILVVHSTAFMEHMICFISQDFLCVILMELTVVKRAPILGSGSCALIDRGASRLAS